MSEQTDIFRAIRDHRKDDHAQLKTINTSIIEQSGMSFLATNNGECLVFRAPKYPMADFFPSSGRWRDLMAKKTYGGGAVKFLKWYLRDTNVVER